METRIKSLDILRAIAVILVLGRHMFDYQGDNLLLYKILHTWNRGGWIGVDLFFVLSGFLISGLLFKEHIKTGSISFKRFFIRRGFKIYPAFYLMIAVTLFMTQFKFGRLFAELFFYQDYTQGLWDHTWSLGVEEKFYLLLPVILILLVKINRSKTSPFNSIPAIFTGVAITCLSLRVFNACHLPYQNYTQLFPFHLRADSLFGGVAISYFYHYHAPAFKMAARRFKSLFLLAGSIFLLPAFLFVLDTTPLLYTAGLTFIYLGSGSILIALIDHEFKPNLIINGLAYMGKYSYSIYLWHMPIRSGFIPHVFNQLPLKYTTWPNFTLSYFIASIFFGILMSKMFEFPVLKLRDRLFPSL
jgi:peptidoglycan/LPS O-acetylase OafA/YrhL